jgi:hypothetical protein
LPASSCPQFNIALYRNKFADVGLGNRSEFVPIRLSRQNILDGHDTTCTGLVDDDEGCNDNAYQFL